MNYMIRGKPRIDRHQNIPAHTYSMMVLLPWLDADFEHLRDMSPQDVRFELGRSINRELFFVDFVGRLETRKNSKRLRQAAYEAMSDMLEMEVVLNRLVA